MLVNQDEITCECGKRIEPTPDAPKPYGWENPLTAEAHVCEECWEAECGRVLRHVRSYTDLYCALKKIKYPVRTFIGRVIEDDVTQKIMERFGVSQT